MKCTNDESDAENEQQMSGFVKLNIYTAFFKAAQSHIYVFIVIILFIVAQIAYSGVDYFIAEW